MINSDTDFADTESMFYYVKAWTHRFVMRVCLISLNLTGSGVIRYLSEGTNVLLWRQMTLEKSLSEKQKQLLKFLSDFNATRGFPPTIREICSHFGLKSLNTVHVQLRVLENKSYLQIHPGKGRGITLQGGLASSGKVCNRNAYFGR